MSKEALRRFYPHAERVLFLEQATEGRGRRSTLGQFLRATRTRAGLSAHELTELTGEYGAINHGGAISNWETGRNIPSRVQYARICEVLEGTGKIPTMPAYEDVVRPFNVSADLEFTDVWNVPVGPSLRGQAPGREAATLASPRDRGIHVPGRHRPRLLRRVGVDRRRRAGCGPPYRRAGDRRHLDAVHRRPPQRTPTYNAGPLSRSRLR